MDKMKLCRDCGVTVLSRHYWRQLPAERRKALRGQGVRELQGRGLCRRCHAARSKNGTLIDVELTNRPRSEVVEEWMELADLSAPFAPQIEQLAPRMGMTPKALEGALRRAGVRSQHDGGPGYRHREGVAA